MQIEQTYVSFALRGRDDGSQPEVCDDGETIGSLRAASGGSSRDYVAFANTAGATNLGIDYENGTAPVITTRHGDPGMVAFTCKDYGGDAGALAPTLRAMTHKDSTPNGDGQVVVAFTQNSRSEVRLIGGDGATTGAVTAEPGAQCQNYVAASAVRRLTPVECERLQGFPDGWTAVPYRGKPAADGPRYRALGNSMAVPVMAWLGERLAGCA
jgi:DNA (cytosine-5)-methyltransferase 1